MTSEQARELTAIYDEAIRKLNDLQVERQHIIKQYIKELEEQKIKALREDLGLSTNQQ